MGHGLTKDFETANIYVPQNQVHVSFDRSYVSVAITSPSFFQIRDTVELWRLPNQRKISLRFLAAYLLKAEIQVSL